MIDVRELLSRDDVMTSDLLEHPTLDTLISPESKVLVVGPGIMEGGETLDELDCALPMDPHVLYLAFYLTTGSLHMLDKPLDKSQGGKRNWEKIERLLKHLKSRGAEICNYGFHIGNILDFPYFQRIGLGSRLHIGSYDVVIDHLMHPFIGMSAANISFNLMYLAEIFRQFLKPEGRVLSYVNPMNELISRPWIDVLERGGFKLKHYTGFDDSYRLQEESTTIFDGLNLPPKSYHNAILKSHYKVPNLVVATSRGRMF